MLGVTVILPTYNRAGLIGETIDSLLNQTRQPDEIIVINDGSTDDTLKVLQRYGGSLRVINQLNSGKSVALNLALAEASTPCIWIVDDDDIILPNSCQILMAELEKDSSLDFCAGQHIDFMVDQFTGERSTREPGYWRKSAPDEIFADLLDGCHIFQPGLIVRREVYYKVGPFRTDLVRSQDYEMILRIARHHRGVLLPEAVFLHREHSGERGSTTDRFAAHENAARWKLYNRHVFTALLGSLEDSELLPARLLTSLPKPQQARITRIKRACVLARQRMWLESITIWDQLAEEGSDPFSPAECEIIDRSATSALGSPELFDDAAVQKALAQLAARGPLGRFLVRRLVRNVRWNLRDAVLDRDRTRVWRVARFLVLATIWTRLPSIIQDRPGVSCSKV
ncbi:MAG: glycosyltransferase [Bryobacteraceae bacterium]|nr:glycosyltransferase [Bryobacteraceae bacterium]